MEIGLQMRVGATIQGTTLCMNPDVLLTLFLFEERMLLLHPKPQLQLQFVMWCGRELFWKYKASSSTLLVHWIELQPTRNP